MVERLGIRQTHQLKSDFSSVLQDVRGPISSEHVDQIKARVLDRYQAHGELTDTVRNTLAAMAELVGLSTAQSQSGLDQQTILRNISNLPMQVGLRDAKPIGDVTAAHDLKTMTMDDFIAAKQAVVDELLAQRGGQGHGATPTGQIAVDQIGGEYGELKKFAWEQHYKPAKAALLAGDVDLAYAHLEVATACLAKMEVMARGNVAETKVVENRIAMLFHQRSLLAHAIGDKEGIVKFEKAALGLYLQAAGREDKNDPPYNPAIFYNAACSLHHLGADAQAVDALAKMLGACKDEPQRQMMKREVYDVDVEMKDSGLWQQALDRSGKA